MVKNRKDITPRLLQKAGTSRITNKASANIRVVVRVRPPNVKELGENSHITINVLDERSLLFDPEQNENPFFYHGVVQKRRDLLKKQHKNMQFNFDRVFNMESTNDEVFGHSTSDLISKLMQGCNCSVFVYGATGAGKTYTMLGKNSEPGITFLTMQELFKQKEELSLDRKFELCITYLEVYNENVFDLLNPTQRPLQLRDDAQFSVRVAGLTHKRIDKADELFTLLEQGNKNRTQHPTDANSESSRSHAVFQVYIQMHIKSTGQKMFAKLSMIDLAGSERAAATGCKGMRFTEGGNINRSLLALGNCINGLADGLRHVPYRDSKLTRILKDSLGENCHTVMIANVSPSSLNFEDTYNTLKYANRAKKIKVNVKKNIVNCDKTAAQYSKIIDELREENLRLKEENLQLKEQVKSSTLVKSDSFSEDSLITEKISSSSGCKTESLATTDQLETRVKSLFDSCKRCEERRQVFLQKKLLLERRILFKNEANGRLSVLISNPSDKENGRKKLVQTMDRLKKIGLPYEKEAIELDQRVQQAQSQILDLVEQNPRLQALRETEQTKLNLFILQQKYETQKCLREFDAKELNVRSDLIEEMAKLIQPWYLLLKNQKLATDKYTKSYQDLIGHLVGYCSVSFDDGDSGLSACSSSTSTNTSSSSCSDVLRPVKRKLHHSEAESNSTFVIGEQVKPSSSSSGGKLAKDMLPSPAKKAAKASRFSPRIMHKENHRHFRKPVGTMGTACRFPKDGSAKHRGLSVNKVLR